MELNKEIEAFTKAQRTPAEKLGNIRIRAYVRVSSDSIGQDQRRQIMAFKSFHEGTELRDKIQYLEVASGKGGVKRVKLHQMAKDAKANRFDVLWVEQPSRLGRNVREGLNVLHQLAQDGVKVYFDKFGKLMDMTDSEDKMMLYFYLMISETEHDWNSHNTTRSMSQKAKQLTRWAKDNGLISCYSGGGKKFSTMIINDPLYNKNPNKKGIVNVEIPHMQEMFQQMFLMDYSNGALAAQFLQPVNPKCTYGCWNGKELPFGSMPREKGTRGISERLTRKEVAQFLAKGSWINYIKTDTEVRKYHPEAFQTKNGEIREKRTCGCGQKMSLPTVSTHVKRLVYDTGLAEKRSPHAFERAEADSTELTPEQVDLLLTSGKVSST